LSYVLVYDSDCGPCTRFRDVVSFFDTRRKMIYIGLDDADRRGVLDSVSRGRRHRSFHLVSPDGTVWSGAEALPPLFELLSGFAPLSFVLVSNPFAFKAASFVYSTFSRLHDAGSCAYAQESDIAVSGPKVKAKPGLPLGVLPGSLGQRPV
jgi:predicted DCC family thiol-disulfide oxidoreductase YuxK